MGRAPCCDKANVKKGPWSPEEDAKLKEYIEKHGTGGNWIALPQKSGLKRCGKSCRLRWLNYLRPNIKHGEFTDYEDRIICSLYASIGSRWSIIAAQLPGRTDNDIKNYWNTKLKKKLIQGMMIYQSPSSQKRSHQNTNYPLSYPINHNNNIIINNNTLLQNTPIPSPYSEIPSLCTDQFPYNNYTISRGYETNSPNFTSLISSNNPTSLFPPQETSKNLIIFGGDQASCSSSDGSCITNQISLGKDNDLGFSSSGEDLGYFGNGVDENQRFLISTNTNNNHGYAAQEEKPAVGNVSDFSEINRMDYSIEEIKQLISTDNICNNLGFFMADHEQIKTEESMLYY